MADTTAITGTHIQFDVYEQKDGKFGYSTNFCVRITDLTLLELLRPHLKSDSEEEVNSDCIRCHSGDFSGEVINLKSKPREVSYISDKLKNKENPNLILIKNPLGSERSLSPELQEPHGRTLSTYLRQMIRGIPDPSPLPLNSRTDSIRLGSVGEEDSLSPTESFSESFDASQSVAKRRPWIKRWRTVDDRATSMGDIGSKLPSQNQHVLTSSASTAQFSSTLHVSSQPTMRSVSPNPGQARKRSMQVFSSTRNAKYNTIPTPISPPPLDHPSFTSNGSFSVSPPMSPPPSPFSPSPDGTRKKRQSRLSKILPAALSPPPLAEVKKGEVSEPIMEISGPQQKQHDWKNRKSENRTAKRGKDRFRSKSRQNKIMPKPTYSSFEIKEVTVQPEDAASFTVSCREFHNVGALRMAIHSSMKKSMPMIADHCPENLTLTYEIDGTTYELFNDCQFIFKTALYEYCRAKDKPLLVKVDLKESNWELPTLYRLSRVTGVMLDEDIAAMPDCDTTHLVQVARNDKKEMEWARRTLHSYVDEIVRERDAKSYSLSMEVESSEAPMLLALKIPIDNKVQITFHYTTVFTLIRKVSVNKTASSVLESIFSCVLACDLVENDVSKYILQVTGERSYLDGSNELIAFRDIRRSILKSEPIHLSITQRPTPEEDMPCKLNWLPIDPYSGEPPLHTDIARGRLQGAEKEEDIWGVSMWDQSNEFGIFVLQVENLPIPMTKEARKLNIVVEATIYHANEELQSGKSTSPKHLTSNGIIELHEAILFGLQIRNLPRAAKIMIVVREAINRKDSSSKKRQPQILFWGLVPVFDHRGLLQSGQYTMALWRGPMPQSKGESEHASYEPNPCIPCNNNPDPGAVKVIVQLSRNTYPVFFPSSAPETCSLMLSNEEDAGAGNVRKQFEKLQSCLANGQLPMSAFPSYIARIDWSKLPQVIEVYALLQQVEAAKNLPVETALKLLDGDFADGKVRAFAVRVLDTLADEQLMDFLLQLTQAIKFEPSHDSALARLLLKRALNNKILGHFFFWYLKCEMYNPQFTPRFAVVLEAYLKGCGESMLKRFEEQAEMQMCLEDIGRQVDHEGGNDGSKMQSILQDLLKKRGIPDKTITPVYNPRLLLGRMNPAKCKIMQSKKKPQWLEMVNIDPTSLKPIPTKLILKIGDDLRQDMIVLRMLSLLEKLWETEGLPDLHLIPYGCMATGPNTGFIEVVKNAKTIADVSGINDNKKLYEWIKSHQKNEYGEEDPVKLQNAIKRFMHSCAGYTVASYVLGIGDRHNDNIMINTSGNLFHIDFGHFLGRIKHFLGVKREWAPFVLTPDFVYVMGGETSETFSTYKNLCCRAFLCLRRHHELIFNLFSLMRSTGIPELACMEDARYINDALMINKPEHEAEQEFRQLIKKCLDLQWTVQIMWWIHVKKKGTSS